MKPSGYRRIFRDVVRGFSTAKLDEEIVYIKHLTPHDQVELEEIEERYYNIALSRGVPTEKDMLEYLKKDGQWTDEDDEVIERGEVFIDSLLKAKGKMILEAQINHQEALIKKESKR